MGDPHHRVAHAVLEAMVEAVPATGRALEPELERLCPPLFPRLVDAKESVRGLASAALSNAQLDAVTLAAIKHAAGYGFLVADSTGCGMGRTAMGVAANWLLKSDTKRVLYLSVKNVALDFFRDFEALKPVFGGLKASNIEKLKELPDSGVVFCAYDRFNTSTIKFEAIMEWVTAGGAVVMDESHTVSNLDCTRGKYANRLVEAVLEEPKCSITFLSATFASKINDLPLYTKPLGLVSDAERVRAVQRRAQEELRGDVEGARRDGALEVGVHIARQPRDGSRDGSPWTRPWTWRATPRRRPSIIRP